jgi:hypothetical protein
MMPNAARSKGDEPLPASTALAPPSGSPAGVLYGSEIRWFMYLKWGHKSRFVLNTETT